MLLLPPFFLFFSPPRPLTPRQIHDFAAPWRSGRRLHGFRDLLLDAMLLLTTSFFQMATMRCANEPAERRSPTSDQLLARPSAALDAACDPTGAWDASVGTAGGAGRAGAAANLGRAGTTGIGQDPPQAEARRDDLPDTARRPAPVEAKMACSQPRRGSVKAALEGHGELPHRPAAVHGWMAQREPSWIDALAVFPVACTRSGNGRSGNLEKGFTEKRPKVRRRRMHVGPRLGSGQGEGGVAAANPSSIHNHR